MVSTYVVKNMYAKFTLFNLSPLRLSQSKQNKVYFPEEPFPHAQLVKSGRLKHFKHVYTDELWNDLRQVNENYLFFLLMFKNIKFSFNNVLIFMKPCVVFCGHPSLRFGDVVHFVEYWGTNPLNTIIFTGNSIYFFINNKTN